MLAKISLNVNKGTNYDVYCSLFSRVTYTRHKYSKKEYIYESE